jgi:hypothetical protein
LTTAAAIVGMITGFSGLVLAALSLRRQIRLDRRAGPSVAVDLHFAKRMREDGLVLTAIVTARNAGGGAAWVELLGLYFVDADPTGESAIHCPHGWAGGPWEVPPLGAVSRETSANRLLRTWGTMPWVPERVWRVRPVARLATGGLLFGELTVFSSDLWEIDGRPIPPSDTDEPEGQE